MAVHYDDSTFWDYTIQDIANILLTLLPYTILLILIKFLYSYKDHIFDLKRLKMSDRNNKNIQDMIGATNEKLQSFSQRLDDFQDITETCSKNYDELVSRFNNFSTDVLGQLEQMGQQYEAHVEDLLKSMNSVQVPITKDTVQDLIKVDSEIIGTYEKTLLKNANFRSRIPVSKKFGKTHLTQSLMPKLVKIQLQEINEQDLIKPEDLEKC